MSLAEKAAISVAVALSPKASRMRRREQWSADCRDAAELGISKWGIVAGALSTSLVSRGPSSTTEAVTISKKEQQMNFSLSTGRTRSIVQLAGGTLVAAALATGIVATGAAWAGNQIQTLSRASTIDYSAGPVTWATVDEGPTPEWTDTSKLIIAGTIDPSAGDVTPTVK
jgi:hypothetical protein